MLGQEIIPSNKKDYSQIIPYVEPFDIYLGDNWDIEIKLA